MDISLASVGSHFINLILAEQIKEAGIAAWRSATSGTPFTLIDLSASKARLRSDPNRWTMAQFPLPHNSVPDHRSQFELQYGHGQQAVEYAHGDTRTAVRVPIAEGQDCSVAHTYSNAPGSVHRIEIVLKSPNRVSGSKEGDPRRIEDDKE